MIKNEERLADIQSKVDLDMDVDIFDIEWLIERVRELEEKLDMEKFVSKQHESYGIKKMEQSELYKQALEDILKEGTLGRMADTGAPVKTREAYLADKELEDAERC